ncbi:MAG: hypothetical protein MUF09_05110 [Candidatus Nanopelagicales bacterium]|nr:hypothetical protein [Candidatus Nanopelagicales bacterium]
MDSATFAAGTRTAAGWAPDTRIDPALTGGGGVATGAGRFLAGFVFVAPGRFLAGRSVADCVGLGCVGAEGFPADRAAAGRRAARVAAGRLGGPG